MRKAKREGFTEAQAQAEMVALGKSLDGVKIKARGIMRELEQLPRYRKVKLIADRENGTVGGEVWHASSVAYELWCDLHAVIDELDRVRKPLVMHVKATEASVEANRKWHIAQDKALRPYLDDSPPKLRKAHRAFVQANPQPVAQGGAR